MLQEQEVTGGQATRSDADFVHTALEATRSCELDELVSGFILELRVLSQELGLDAEALVHAHSRPCPSADHGEHLTNAPGFAPRSEGVCAAEPVTAPIEPAAQLATAVSESERAQLTEHRPQMPQGLNTDETGCGGTGTSASPDVVPDRTEDRINPAPEVLAPPAKSGASDAGETETADGSVVNAERVNDPFSARDPLDPNAGVIPPTSRDLPKSVTAGDSPEELGDIDSALRNIVLRKKPKRRFLFLPW